MMSELTATRDSAAPPRAAGVRDEGFYPRLYLLAALLVLAAATMLRIDQEARVVLPGLGVALPDTCWFFRWFGLGCPGCGLTRSFICLMDGDFAGAWRHNPGGFPCFLLVAGQIPFQLWQLWRLRSGRPLIRPQRLTVGVLLGTMLVLLVQWAVRLLVG